ncbi:MAG: hypothetical protein CM1200mP15_12720 [Dehalococcoidia bacterium]|nr:MAG: hypothetical protein CM1200mP15_12720 [Dehalococcoidia bacterium]
MAQVESANLNPETVLAEMKKKRCNSRRLATRQ